MSDLALSIATSALIADQDCLNVTSQNVSNASTTGYSRETAELVTSPSIPVPSLEAPSSPGQFGTGVEVSTVTRDRDQFLDTQYRQQNLLLGQYTQQSDALSQLETVFGNITSTSGTSTTGLDTDLDNFWQAWDTLSQEPEDLPQRTTVVETAATLADDLQSTYNQLTTLQGNLNTSISGDVSQINDDLQQIAGLNNSIQAATAAGLAPNSLLDTRDSLLDNLSTYVNVKTVINSDGTATLSIGGTTVVNGSSATQLVALSGSGSYQVGVDLGSGETNVISGSALGGSLYGLQQAWGDVGGYVTQLNSLTSGIASAVNEKQESGYDLSGILCSGIPFFVGSASGITAAHIAVASGITNNPNLLGAASSVSGVPGDGSNALSIYDLSYTDLTFTTSSGGSVSTTANGYYGSMISDLGVASKQAQNAVTNQTALTTQLNNNRQSVSGVSLDEEMTNMVEEENAYEAAAKLVNVIAGMMQTVIDMVPTSS